MSLDEVARKFPGETITADRICRWEEEKELPSYSMLETLAYNVYKVPLAIFFFSEPVDLSDFKKSMRTLDPNAFNQIPTRIIQLMRKARALQLGLFDIFGSNPAEKKIWKDIRLTRTATVEETAIVIREYLGFDLNNQIHSKDAADLFRYLRNRLEDVGIFTFKDAFKESDYSGFCLYDNEFPIIYVNNSMPANRQLFTLFHELSHILLETSGIDFRSTNIPTKLYSTDYDTEVFCNRLAAEILVPSCSFLQFENAAFDDIQDIARYYSVSSVVIARRLLSRGSISQVEYNKIQKEAKEIAEQKKDISAPIYYPKIISYLGKKYVLETLSKLSRNELSPGEASNYLNVKVTNLNKLQKAAL